MRDGIAAPGKAANRDDLFRTPQRCPRSARAQERADHDIFQNRHGIEAADDLKRSPDAEPCTGNRADTGNPLAREEDLAAIGRDLAGDDVETTAGACGVGTDQAEHNALRDIETGIAFGRNAAEGVAALA